MTSEPKRCRIVLIAPEGLSAERFGARLRQAVEGGDVDPGPADDWAGEPARDATHDEEGDDIHGKGREEGMEQEGRSGIDHLL